jgi:hypothetical protein
LRSFRELGIPRIVIVGSVPVWPRTPQSLLFAASRADPQRRIPNRLLAFDRQTAEVDRQLQSIASQAGAIYVSAQDVLCNRAGCLARLGDTAPDIVQVDRTHLSAAGSWYLVSRIAAQIFEGDGTPRVADAPTGERAQ